MSVSNLSEVRLSQGLALWMVQNGGTEDDTTYSYPASFVTSLADVSWISSVVTKPTEQELIDVYNGWLLKIEAATAIQTIQLNSKIDMGNIPAWASYTEQQAIDYINANVTDLASVKEVLLAIARMVVVLRNHEFPELQE